MATFVYKSTDVGAPVITTAAGSFRDFLKKCLVTGYGSLPGAGWTEQFVSGNVSVFAGATAGSAVLQVNDSGVVTPASATVGGITATSAVALRMFDSMTSATVGVNMTPNWIQQPTFGMDKSNRNAYSWVLVATGDTFHFMSNNSGGGSVQRVSFGKFNSLLPGDTQNSIIVTGSQTANNDTNCTALNSGNGTGTLAFIPHDYTGIGNSRNVGLDAGQGQGTMGYLGGSGNALAFPNQIDGKLHMWPIKVYEVGAGFRGVLPGIYSGGCPQAPFANLDTITGADGKTFIAMQGAGVGYWCFLETSSTW